MATRKTLYQITVNELTEFLVWATDTRDAVEKWVTHSGWKGGVGRIDIRMISGTVVTIKDEPPLRAVR